MKMKLNSFKISAVVRFAVVPVGIFAGVLLTVVTSMAQDDFECFKNSGRSPSEGEVCIVVPSDVPPASSLHLRSEGPAVSMLSQRELSGAALEPVDISGLELDVNDEEISASGGMGMETASISQSVKTQEQLRWIETFLKTGPSAGSPDIRVTPSVKPSK